MDNKCILHLIPNMAGGGAERQLSYLCEGLQKRGWDLHVALLSGGVNYRRLLESGATIHVIKARGNYDPLILFRLQRLTRSLRPRLVQTWNPMMDILGGVCALITGNRWILSENNSAPAYRPTRTNLLRRVIGVHCTAIISVSDTGLDYWRPLTSADTYCTPLAPHFAEIEATPPDLALANLAQRQEVILFAGRFVPEKNVERLVRVLGRIVTERNAVAFLCGEGPLRERLHAAAEAQGLGALLRFPGYVEDVTARMKAAHVFVSLSTFEGRPNTIAEAMACRCPLVLSNIPSHAEMVGSDSAFYCDPLDELSIAAAVRQALDHPNAAREKAARAYSRISRHSMEAFLDQYEQIYARYTGVRQYGRGTRRSCTEPTSDPRNRSEGESPCSTQTRGTSRSDVAGQS